MAINSYACNFESIKSFSNTDIENIGGNYKKCSRKNSAKRACRCVNSNKSKIDPPAEKLTELDKIR